MTRARFALSLWATAFIACMVLLVADWLWFTRGRPDFIAPTLGRLALLSLLGSMIGAATTGAAVWARSSRRRTRLTIAAALLGSIVPATKLSPFLLSGAKWANHPQRNMFLAIGAAMLTAIGGAAWVWIARGVATPASSSRGRRIGRTLGWHTISIFVLVGYAAAAQRHRVYDYAIAWSLPIAVTLASLVVWRIVPARSRWSAVTLAVLIAVPMVAWTQWDSEERATGRRSVLASTRLGAISEAYLVPSVRTAELRANEPCAPAQQHVMADPIPVDANQRTNVILISIDATRSDVIDQRIGEKAVAPNLRELFTQGIRFTRAASTYPATLYALGSAFTSWSPAELFMAPSLPPTIFTLVGPRIDRTISAIQDDPWFRLGIVRDFLLRDANPEFTKPERTLTDRFIERLASARADGQSVLGWVHYVTPHDPYTPRKQFDFGRGKKSAYYSEVALVDEEIGRLMRYLRLDNWTNDTLIIVFSNHGESLGERNYWGHHVYLNRWMIDVPLLVLYPGAEPESIATRVSLLDVAPTILHFLGLPISSEMTGESLFTVSRNNPDRATYSEAFPMRHLELFEQFKLRQLSDDAIRSRLRTIRTKSKGYEPKNAIALGDYRLIRNRSTGAEELFNQVGDPNELSDLKQRDPEPPPAITKALDDWEAEQLRRISCRLLGDYAPTEALEPTR